MEYKKSIIILILTIFLFSIASVCASDVNDTATASADDTIVLFAEENDLNTIENDDGEILSANDDENYLKVSGNNPGTFSDLSKEIKQVGETILEHDYYTYDKGSTIYITADNIVINGNGAVIDMAGSNICPFYVTSSGVTIKNLTIKNSNGQGNGGAIFFENYATVEDCNFDNNKANPPQRYGLCNGGAIFFYGGGHLLNCNFTKNRSDGDNGGAVFFSVTRTTIIENCNFIDNYADTAGGAVYLGEGTIKNCNFKNNVARSLQGGGVFYFFGGEVINCNFTNNKANSFSGGGVHFSRNSKAINCSFIGNSAKYGGAVYFEWNYEGNITNCEFVNNSATKNSGAVGFTNKAYVENCNFTGNNAPIASAIGFYSGSSIKKVSNSIFLENWANPEVLEITPSENNVEITFGTKDNLINAIHSSGSVSFDNVTYWGDGGIKNTGEATLTPSKSSRGAGHNITVIMLRDDVVIINETRFTDENGTIILDTAGVGFYNITARHDKDSYSGKIETKETFAITSLKLTASKWTVAAEVTPGIVAGFVNFTVTNESGIVKNDKISVNDGIALFELNGLFAGQYNITANYEGEINYFTSSANITHVLTSSKNTYSSLSKEIGSGGNVKLKYDYYTYDVGATIAINEQNSVIDGRGAVIDMAYSDIRALKVMAFNVTIRNLTIKNANFGNSHGGAIYFINSGTVENCTFVNNTVEDEGGAVYFDKYESTGHVFDCSFINNTATSGFGGAAYFLGNGEVKNCKFINNTAKYSGGAIDILYSCNITNCIFTGNMAILSRGGAVYTHSAIIENCNFTDNSASQDGGAIMISHDGNISDCNFISNNAETGSAIYFYDISSAAVSNSLFLNNRANVSSTPFEIHKNDNKIEIQFIGQDNLINAIYSDGDVSFTNVTYWGADGISNTGNLPVILSRTYREAGQNITVIVVVNEILVLNETKITDENGTVVLDLVAGNYTVKAGHDADSYYTSAQATGTFNTTGNETGLMLNASGLTVTATVTPDTATGNVIFTVTNESGKVKTAEVNLKNGVAIFELAGLAIGKYNVTATYSGSISNYPKTDDIAVSIKNDVPINLGDISITFGDDAIVIADVPEAINGQNVTVTVNRTSKNATVIGGRATANFTGLSAGEYDITVNYLGDESNNANSTNAKLTVHKADSTLAVDNMAFDYGGTGSAAVSFTGASSINATVIGQPKAIINISNNMITVSGLNAGSYTLEVATIPDENHNSVSRNATISVNRLKTQIDGNAVTAIYNADKNLAITLKDANGNALSGVTLTVDLNGVKTYITDKNGKIMINVGKLVPKTYTAKITFKGNDNYQTSSAAVKVTVKKAKAKIVAKKKTFKMSKKVKKYVVTLKSGKTPIKKVKVTLKIKKKIYKAKTNSKGKATFKIKKMTKKGTYKATIKFKGNKYYTATAKKVKIKIK